MLSTRLTLPIAVLALTVGAAPAASALGRAPVTKADLPTQAEARQLTPRQTFDWLGVMPARTVDVPNAACDGSISIRMPGKAAIWITGMPDLSELEPEVGNGWNVPLQHLKAMPRVGHQPIVAHGVSVQRARTAKQARQVMNRIATATRACPVVTEGLEKTRIKPMRVPGGGQQRFGFSAHSQMEGMPIKQGAAFYRKGRTVVMVLRMSMTPGASFRPAKKLVRLALRKGF